MALAPGTRLGLYEILSPLGAGGMGEVYRARDTKLDREVAIKILPEAVAGDPERLARFEREAKVLASLNHPNVAQIYGVVESETGRALVMELVPGGPLKGPVLVEKALDYARQIVSALEAAHEKGIVHRDLKPVNIMVTPAGVVKVLDFGLAAQSREMPPGNAEDSPTFTMHSTGTGVILGTAAYMSPEQARGEPVDKRADIWAFGVVLYELLTGKGIFGGKTVTDVLAAVLITEPDLSPVPTSVRRLLRRCLEKDPRKRLRDIGDALLLLEDDEPSQKAAVPTRTSRAPWIVAGVLLVIAAAAGIAWWRASSPAEEPMVRVDVDLGDVRLAMPAGSSCVIISPDGTQVAYLATAASEAGSLPRLFLRKLDQATSTELPGTQGANSPFFSQDGRWIGFSIGRGLYKIALDGTPGVHLGEPGPSAGSVWSDDQSIRTGVLLKGLLRTPAAGGTTETTLKLADDEIGFLDPNALPDGKGVLYSILPVTTTDRSRARVEVLTPDGKRRPVAQGGITTRYLPASKHAGYLVYAIKRALYAVPFDPDRLEAHGTPVQVLDDVEVRQNSQFDVSRTGTLVYRRAHGSPTRITMLQWVDTAGKRETLPVKPAGYNSARIAPDGRKIVAYVVDEDIGIQILDLQRETWTPVPLGGRNLFHPIWSPDSQTLIISSIIGLAWTRAAGSSEPEALMPVKSPQVAGSTTADGKRLVYVEDSGIQGQLWTVPLDNAGGQLKAGTPEPYIKSSSKDTFPRFSSDGKWIAYASTATGANEIYVRGFPDNGSVVKISNNGGDRPIWSPMKQEVLYQAGDQMMAVAYTDKGGSFVPEKPRVWTPKIGGTAFDISPDGKKLLVIVPVESPNVVRPDHEIVLFQNFVGYLREKVK